MGSPDSEADRRGDEGPQHQVRITKPFYMGIHEVTQGGTARNEGENPSYIKGPQQPVEWLNWEKTARFCDVLSALPTEKALGRTYGLPTEAQWEYACRAGTAERYNFGDEVSKLGEYAWSSEKPLSEFKVPCVTGRAHPVGQEGQCVGPVRHARQCAGVVRGLVWRVVYGNSPVDDPPGPATVPAVCSVTVPGNTRRRSADQLAVQPQHRRLGYTT